MRVRSARLAAAALGSALLVGPVASRAYAHETRPAGPARMTVGWVNEPTYVGFLNAVQVRLADDSGPITDVGDGLKVEVTFGDQKIGPLALAPAFESPGEYRAPLVPSRPGTYTFRFVGTVKGQQIDLSFTSSETTFDSPKDTADIEFPVKDPSRGQLASRVDRIEPRLDQVRTAVESDVDDAKSAASRATALAVVGMVVGVAGIAVGVTARRRNPSSPIVPEKSSAKAVTGP